MKEKQGVEPIKMAFEIDHEDSNRKEVFKKHAKELSKAIDKYVKTMPVDSGNKVARISVQFSAGPMSVV